MSRADATFAVAIRQGSSERRLARGKLHSDFQSALSLAELHADNFVVLTVVWTGQAEVHHSATRMQNMQPALWTDLHFGYLGAVEHKREPGRNEHAVALH